MVKKTNIPGWSIGALKTFKGHEGETCLQGTLLLDGVTVAEWSDDSWGGPMQMHFKDKSVSDLFARDAAEKGFPAICARDPEWTPLGEGMSPAWKAEVWLGDMAQAAQEEKELKSLCRRKVVLKDPSNGDIYTLKLKWDPSDAEMAAKIEKANPGFEIVNRRFPDLTQVAERSR